jgi:LPXTG-motif cell wall-anchored protein
VNLSVKKLRRSATVIGGAIAGLGVVAAMATPALACEPIIKATNVCANADGTWVIDWSVTATDSGIGGEVTAIDKTPTDSVMTGIELNKEIPAEGALTGTQTMKATDKTASIQVTAKFHLKDGDIFAPKNSEWINKPTSLCTPPSSSAPATTSPTPKPSVTTTPPPVKEDNPELVYDETCTTLTVGLKLPKSWDQSETVTFKPSTGAAKTVTAKPGETKTVDFPASKNLTVTAISKSNPKDTATISYQAPADCTSAAPTSSAPVLAITGSSSAPLAGGAIALVLVGGGAFFLARRRKMKFTA